MSYTIKDLEIDFRKDTGVSWERSGEDTLKAWLIEKVIKSKNDDIELNKLFIRIADEK